MTPVTIHLIRHGAHDEVGRVLSGRGNVALNEAGRAEAALVGRSLAAGGLAALYSSPVARARETADAITEAGAPAAEIDVLLTEIDFGEWTGAAFADLDPRPEWRAWNEDRGRRRPPGGESMLEAQSRVARWLDRACGLHSGGAVAAVSHADVIKAAVAYALGLPLHFHDRLEIAPGSATTLIWDGGFKVLRVNEAFA